MRNNLQPKRSVEESSHIGLENIRQRYRALTGMEIEVEKTEDYFTVRVCGYFLLYLLRLETPGLTIP